MEYYFPVARSEYPEIKAEGCCCYPPTESSTCIYKVCLCARPARIFRRDIDKRYRVSNIILHIFGGLDHIKPMNQFVPPRFIEEIGVHRSTVFIQKLKAKFVSATSLDFPDIYHNILSFVVGDQRSVSAFSNNIT